MSRHRGRGGRVARVEAIDLRAWALQEADELGPEPIGSEPDLGVEERLGAIVLPSALADHDRRGCGGRAYSTPLNEAIGWAGLCCSTRQRMR